jgi:curved DNA-binding protein CbpA
MGMAAQPGEPAQDLYQVLGVTRGASGGEITRAWRQRALAEHPDARPGEADASARFRAVAEAYQVLGDPVRRAAYDRALGDRPGPGGRAGVVVPAGGRPTVVRPTVVPPGGRAAEPSLRAGPVWVEVPGMAPGRDPYGADDDAVRLAALAELAARYLAGDWGWPW